MNSPASPLAGLRLGYVPYSRACDRPGDRRRFAGYAARRGIRFELADPREAYDVVVLSELADITVWRDYAKGRIVYDLIDSYLAIPRSDLKGRLRGLAKFVAGQHRRLRLDYRQSVEAMCRRADAVVCTTLEQQQDIAPLCANVHRVLDLHGGVARRAKTGYAAGTPFRLAWEGLAATVEALQLIGGALRALERVRPLALEVVTDPVSYRYLGRYGRRDTADLLRGLCTRVTLQAWHEATCADLLCACDAAVIPLDLDDPFAAGKPENKLLLLWRLGLPVVASATPAYSRAMQAAGVDLGCRDAAEWERTLLRVIDDENLRAEAGRRGRAYAEAAFGEAQLLAAWDAVFASLGAPAA